MFTREKLEKNNYFIYRMSMNLEIPLQAVYDERNIKNITQDSQIVLNVKQKLFQNIHFLFEIKTKALKKTKNVKVNEEKEIFIPIVNSMANKLIVNIQAKDEDEFRKFLQQENWTNNVIVFKSGV